MGRHEVAIIGTGFSGLGMAIRLKQAGVHDFVVFEEADDVGGTWRDNTYPGAACDIPSHLYSFSFAPNPRWTTMYGKQDEIFAYLQHCADAFDVRRHILFRHRVSGSRFDADKGEWEIETNGNGTHRARFVVSGIGGLSRPNLPDIKGLDRFSGETCHSARWRHDMDLSGKRVGIVGTGASAIQLVPQLAKTASHLTVFQRTPPWVVAKEDREIPKKERARYDKFPLTQRAYRYFLYWRLEWRALAFTVAPQLASIAQRDAEAFLRHSVKDASLRAKLTPDYTFGCKRVLLANDYYPALQKENVTLCAAGVDEVTKNGVHAAGEHHELDALIFCTGFQAADDLAPFDIVGLDGRTLADEWSAGAEAYLGTTVHGFPNLFLLVGPNTGLGHNSMVFMIESQIQYVLSCLRTVRRRRAKYLDVRADVQSAFNRRLDERLGRTVWASGCQSWYQARTGKITALWPGFTVEYRLRTRRMRPKDFEFAT